MKDMKSKIKLTVKTFVALAGYEDVNFSGS